MNRKIFLILALSASVLMLIFAILCDYLWSQYFISDVLLSLFGSLLTAVLISGINLYTKYKEYINEKEKILYELKIYCDDLLSYMEVIYYSTFYPKDIPAIPEDTTNKKFVDFACEKILEACENERTMNINVFTHTEVHRSIIACASWIYSIARKINNDKDFADMFSENERNASQAIMNDSINFTYNMFTTELVAPLKELFDCVSVFTDVKDYANDKYIKRDIKLIGRS